ncbi:MULTISPECIES: WGR domain-containing protein [Rhizobium]|uniref:WGR domain-containing protein n=1 Tax=Rhizobium laguerreae TaxID=1076926 RepID=A0A7Y2RC49_9HYPH|nr:MULTISPECIES: WGR domain-containing protein [Rhizobium]MBW8787591.1 WGR domain-containing protein [Rhizobium leguminosarum]MBY5370845.1 WGR domain-containing protein [Rhizobium leguminosarum]MBY5406852.1 WGR domain-containing protein [Rhizobium leguminosarum]MBY5450292.1 WGR domain-containing protein [Rhizobium leguminosarum]NDK49441.1 WGR domain-containing protein [Rhizobium laguerreae]
MISGMTRMSFHLHCRRIDASRNMARYYTLAIEPTLFGETAVLRSWGRIGRRGGERTDVFGTEQEAVAHFLDLARRKHRKGYRPTKVASAVRDPT